MNSHASTSLQQRRDRGRAIPRFKLEIWWPRHGLQLEKFQLDTTQNLGQEKIEIERRKDGTGKRRKKYNPNHQLNREDFVFTSDIITDERQREASREWKYRDSKDSSCPLGSAYRDLFPDLRLRLNRRRETDMTGLSAKNRDNFRP